MKLIAVLGEVDYAYEFFLEHCSDQLSELWELAYQQPNHKYYFELEDKFNPGCDLYIEAIEYPVTNSFFDWLLASGLLDNEHVGLIKVADDNSIHPRG
jgi:hypothetical protein